MNILGFSNFYFVGIKGVAMTSLAQILIDADKKVQGSDVPQKFVTENKIQELKIKVDHFDLPLPSEIDCVVYTAAHNGVNNPQVQWAQKHNIPTFSQAEALSFFFNSKKGIAVCGVGGKSTTSAMITWILKNIGKNPSFSVGVGNIPGLEKTGAWTDSKCFVAEADEYVIDPSAPEKGIEITPRFSFLKPFVNICTNLRYDHPDVYRDFEHTKEVFLKFFQQTQDDGFLVINADDQEMVNLAKKTSKKIITFGENENADFQLTNYSSQEGTTKGTFKYKEQSYSLKMQIPGKFNILNALAAIAAIAPLHPEVLTHHNLRNFRSTARRFENMGKINGVQCFDDYAHHPKEVAAAIQALNEWYPKARKVIAFQSHTYSRTKQLFADFVDSFSKADEVVMIDIFSSAREKSDTTVSSTILCKTIEDKFPKIKAKNLETLENLSEFFKKSLQPGDVFLTLGAGDIYEVYEAL